MKGCPVFDAANILGKKWMYILMQEIALNGQEGFNFISKRIKFIRSRVLSKRLDELEKRQLISRKFTNDKPKKVLYKLTPKGAALYDIAIKLKSWSEEYCQTPNCLNRECVKCELYLMSGL